MSSPSKSFFHYFTKTHGIAVLITAGYVLFETGCTSFYYHPQTVPKVSAVASETQIPISFQTGAPSIDIKINREGPYTFLLSTGTAISFIGSDLSDKLKLKTGSIKDYDVIISDGGVDSISYKQIDSLDVGQSTFQKFDCIRSTQPVYNSPEIMGFHGTLGIGVFSNALVRFNYYEKTLIIKDGYLSPEDKDVIPIKLSDFDEKILFEGTLNGNKKTFALALGGSFGLYLNDEVKQEVNYLESPKPFDVKHSQTGLYTEYRGQLDGYIEIGKHRIENPMVYTSPEEAEIISEGAYYEDSLLEKSFPAIGGYLLDHFEVSIDQRSRLMRLQRLHPDPIQLQ